MGVARGEGGRTVGFDGVGEGVKHSFAVARLHSTGVGRKAGSASPLRSGEGGGVAHTFATSNGSARACKSAKLFQHSPVGTRTKGLTRTHRREGSSRTYPGSPHQLFPSLPPSTAAHLQSRTGNAYARALPPLAPQYQEPASSSSGFEGAFSAS